MKYLVLFLILSLSYIPFGQNTKGSGAVWLVAQAHAASPKARAKTENVKARKQPPRSYKSKATAKGKSAGTRKTNLKPKGYIRYSSAKAGSANYRLKKAMPTIKAPYKHGSSVYSFKTRKNEKFVRVYAEGKSQPAGKWLVRAKEIKGLSPAQVQQKLALPFKPTHMSTSMFPKGLSCLWELRQAKILVVEDSAAVAYSTNSDQILISPGKVISFLKKGCEKRCFG